LERDLVPGAWSIEQRKRARDRAFTERNEGVLDNPAAHSNLRVARCLGGVTQAELARAAGVCTWTLAGIEQCKMPGRRTTRKKIAAALGVKIEVLFPNG
jgi:DNA-binding XRE family transcriptional regulator